jgi:hypothetical protein
MNDPAVIPAYLGPSNDRQVHFVAGLILAFQSLTIAIKVEQDDS